MATLTDLESQFPPAVSVDPANIARENTRFLVVIDDDPTGTQPIANLPVVTRWTVDDLAWAMGHDVPAVFVIANTRAEGPDRAREINREIMEAALAASEQTGREIAVVSRSDSTLRGHFPLEPDVIRSVWPADGVIVVPAFPDAGRVTIDSVHYAASGNELIPVGQSEFASDATFGFQSSDLRQWVEEKSEGRWSMSDVARIGLVELRTDLDAVVETLVAARDGRPIVCDATCEDDLRRLALAAIEAEKAGQRFIYRTGPTFVRARIGQSEPQPVRPQATGRGGLVVVGSHVGLTTRQLANLDRIDHDYLEIDVHRLLGGGRDYVTEVAERAVEKLSVRTVVLATTRQVVRGADGADSLDIARTVSRAVVDIVRHILSLTRPSFVLAKGGITSSDIASKAVEMNRAWVVGPMLPGLVSMWRAMDGPNDGTSYVVFPGNVGDENSLADVIDTLEGRS